MLNVPFKLKGMTRVDETPVHKAVREALVNCLVNADYFLPRGVVIECLDDKIILKNPGSIIVGKRQMLKGGDSEPRNAAVMKMFNLLGFGERAGCGVPDIFAARRWAGLAPPRGEEAFQRDAPCKTIVTLPLERRARIEEPEGVPKTESGADASRSSEILTLLRADGTLSRAEIARRLGLTDKQARTAMDKLRKEGIIRREGSSRGGRWLVE